MRIIKFCLTGAVGLAVNLSTFQTLYRIGIPYLLGSAIAFLISMVVGFTLQRYWTFAIREADRARVQFAQYAALAVTNLAVNTGVVYVLVEHIRVHHLIAQTVGAGLVAVTSYLAYSRYIFASRPQTSEAIPE